MYSSQVNAYCIVLDFHISLGLPLIRFIKHFCWSVRGPFIIYVDLYCRQRTGHSTILLYCIWPRTVLTSLAVDLYLLTAKLKQLLNQDWVNHSHLLNIKKLNETEIMVTNIYTLYNTIFLSLTATNFESTGTLIMVLLFLKEFTTTGLHVINICVGKRTYGTPNLPKLK